MPTPAQQSRLKSLGLIAGGGALPRRLLSACDSKNINVFIVGLAGHVDPSTIEDRAHIVVRPGAAGKIIQELKERNIRDLVMIGSVRRPSLWALRPDLRAFRFMIKVGFRARGDNSFLTAVRQEIESDGFKIHAIQDFVDDILMSEGLQGGTAPTPDQERDIKIGIEATQDLGRRDKGQAAIVLNGKILGTEDRRGTNALIRRCAGGGGILVKTCKPQQDRALDLPSIGSDTVNLCADLGYAGIAVQAGATLVPDMLALIELANRRGIFVIGVKV